tara:strand:+ start:2067 stop:2327 length:261 start_codon:yes stop_codon:yes gene_type:complete
MNDQAGILVVSTVPTVGYLVMQGLTNVVAFILCAIVSYYLLKHMGIDMLARLRNETEEPQKIEKNTKSKTSTNGVIKEKKEITVTE